MTCLRAQVSLRSGGRGDDERLARIGAQLARARKELGHGRMRSHRLIITTTLLVLAVSAMAPTAAGAGPLLSGYGGPGQGNQAILGSALLNGGSGGSGGGGSGGRGSSAGGFTAGLARRTGSAGAGTGAGSTAGAGAAGGAPAPAPSGRGKHATGPVAGASSGGSTASARSSSLTASRGGVGGSQALGLSGADLLYILLAFGVLVFTGLLTRRLAREPSSGREAG